MMDTGIYYGANERELRDLPMTKRLIGLIDHRRLFPYYGQIKLEPDRLVLEGWQEIPRAWIVGVNVEFTDVYSRFLAAGVRGQGASLGALGQGKPLILSLARGKSPIYLLVDYNWLAGTNQNKVWQQRIFEWLNHLEAV